MQLPTNPYFAYGSNLNRAEMRRRCPNARPDRPARLDGWRLTFRGVADIEQAEDRAVHGALWWLSEEDFSNLDAYEGAPTHYRRRPVEVETAAGPRNATTYVMTDASYLGIPSPLYLGRVEAGFRDWRLPLDELQRALDDAHVRLSERGIRRYRPDGRKRLRAVLDDPEESRPRR